MSHKKRKRETDVKENKSEENPNAKRLKTEPSAPIETHMYTDGSCDMRYKVAGCGVYFPDHLDMNISSSDIPGAQTNNRAEVYAIYLALQSTREHDQIAIFSDSIYAIKCIANKWEKKVNTDLFDMIDEELQHRRQQNFQQRICHVRGHSGNTGNDQADKLAKEAMRAKRKLVISDLEERDEECQSYEL